MARLMPSISECRQPYLLSNLLLVTESLTLIAGNSSEPAACHLVEAVHAGGGLLGDALDARRRCGSSGWRPRPASAAARRGRRAYSSDVGLVGGRHQRRPPRTRRPCGRAWWRRRRRRGSCSGRRRPARPADLLGAPPVLLQRLALPGEDRDALRGRPGCRSGRRRRRRRRGPGWRRCCRRPSGPRRRARRGSR